MGKVDLRAAKSPPPKLPFQPRTIPGLGQVPLRPGEVVTTEGEKKDLIPLGWKEDDPIPPQLAEAIDSARRAALADVKSGKLRGFENQPPLKTPTEIPIEKLPAEHQARLRKMIDDFRIQATQTPSIDPANYDPSVLKAIRESERVADKGYEIFDSRKQQTPPTEPGVSTMPPPQPPTPGEATQAAAAPALCPRCGWDQKLPAAAEPDTEDKANYLIAIRGGNPFLKRYSLFGGHVIVIMRRLSSAGSDLVRQQLSADQRDGRVLNLNDMVQMGTDYRTVLTLSSVRVDDESHDVADSVDEILTDRSLVLGADATPLPGLVQQIKQRAPFDTASFWNVLAATADRFHAVFDTLEQRAGQADFWVAIGG